MLYTYNVSEAVDVRGELINLTNNVISRMIMSKRCYENEDEAGQVRTLIQEIGELLGKFNLSEFIWFCKNLDLQGFRKRLRHVRDTYNEMMERIIREHEEARRKRKKSGGGSDVVKDLLDILLDISEDETSEIRLTKENIKAFILDIFFAGTDTTAITIEWALAELINHPNILEKAQQEIDSVVGKMRPVEESDIANLPYLQAIVKETLRLHPAAPLSPRESTQDSTVGGYRIPANTRLIVNIWSINHDPNYWKDPLEFQPDRFFYGEGDGRSQLDVRGQHFHLLPFGSGRRGCPGTSLALKVVQTSLATIIQCFEWKVGAGGNRSVDMEEGPGFTVPRAHPLLCVPVARLNPFRSGWPGLVN